MSRHSSYSCWVPPFKTKVLSQREYYSWGSNYFGQLGNGTNITRRVPILIYTSGVLAGKTIIQLSGGLNHSLALDSEGNVYSWGRNSEGQLGNGSNIDSNVPVAVLGILAGKKIIQISAGRSHSLALDSNGKVYAWGYNYYGQLGDGSNINKTVPVAVNTVGLLAGKTIIQISGGGNYSLALDSNEKVYSWGRNLNGQLGDGTNIDSNVAVTVNTAGVLAGKIIIQISAGGEHTLALDSEGKVYSWGYNANGQLGNGANIDSNVPVAVNTSGVLAGKTIIQISAGYDHSLALDWNGKIYTWGNNNTGQLGDNTNTASNVPVTVNTSGLLGGKTIIQISGGTFYSLAVDSTGKAYTWGDNTFGQLGNGSNIDSNVPVGVNTTEVLDGKKIIQISAGGYHSLAIGI